MGPKDLRPLADSRRRGVIAAGAPALSAAELTAYAGDYYSDEVDATYHVTVSGGSLVYSARHIPAQMLTAIGPDTFRARGGITLHFERPAGASIPTAFTIEAGRVRNIRFVRR
jgi:hypothetical protein